MSKTKYYRCGIGVDSVEVLREAPKSYITQYASWDGNHRERRRMKDSSAPLRDTWKEAHADAIAHQESQLDYAIKRVDRIKGTIAKLRAMTDPTEAKQ